MTTHAKFVKPHMRGRKVLTGGCYVNRSVRIPKAYDDILRGMALTFSTSKSDLIRRFIAHGIKAIKEKTNAEQRT